VLKIPEAVDLYLNRVSVEEAVKEEEYYCPKCLEPLTLATGEKMRKHFRHHQKADPTIVQYCEDYTQSGHFTLSPYFHEKRAEQQPRLILKEEEGTEGYAFFLQFPLLEGEQIVKMDVNDYYFSFEVQGRRLLSKDLISEGENRLKIELDVVYPIQTEGMKEMELLEYPRLEDLYKPFEEGPVLFKRLRGEWKSVHYKQVIATDEFFIVSRYPLTFVNDISYQIVTKGDFLIYRCYTERGLTHAVKKWFTKYTRYMLEPAQSHIDLIEPQKFLKRDGVYLVEQPNIRFEVHHKGLYHLKDHLEIRNINDQTVNERRIFGEKRGMLTLSEGDVYIIHLILAKSDPLLVKYVDKITYPTIDYPEIKINEEPISKTAVLPIEEKYRIEPCGRDLQVETEVELYRIGKENQKYELEEFRQVNVPYNFSVFLQRPVAKFSIDDFSIVSWERTDPITYGKWLMRAKVEGATDPLWRGLYYELLKRHLCVPVTKGEDYENHS